MLALPALYFVQTTIHEGTHAFSAWTSSGDFPKFAPFPHVTPDGRFLNGVAFTGGKGFPAAPQFVALSIVVVVSLICALAPIRSEYVRLALRLWLFGASVDLCYNTSRGLYGGHNPYADWSKFQDQAGIATALMVVLTWLIWLIVLSHFVWVYWSAWHRHPHQAPAFGEYGWVALGLGLVSLVAVVVSLAVNDPKIVKAHVAFILPLIVQILALAWHSVYFIRQTFYR